jgi:hypothetical protein
LLSRSKGSTGSTNGLGARLDEASARWKQTSLLRRTVVTVAAFVMLACGSIATMSFAALAATKAVFQPPPSTSAAAASAPSADLHDASRQRASEGAEKAPKVVSPSRGILVGARGPNGNKAPGRAKTPDARGGDEE